MSKINTLTLLGAGVAGTALVIGAMMFANSGKVADAAKPAAEAPKPAPTLAAVAPAPLAPAQTISAAEADAWAAARGADTAAAYQVYLAAYPTGLFRAAAVERLAAAEPAKPIPAAAPAPKPRTVVVREPARPRPVPAAAPAPAPEPVFIPAAQPLPPAPIARNVAGECRAYVEEKLSKPSRLGRAVGGAAGGCAAGTLAGGDDGRNCAIGAVIGGAAGAISAESRERRRMREVEFCIANGGPPG